MRRGTPMRGPLPPCMRHVKQVDARQHTVVMLQVENEMGMSIDTRDRSPAADKAYAGPVPKALLDYLQQHKETLNPGLRKVWEAAGSKTSGTWEEVFGQNTAADEIFMAWNYAQYAGRVAAAGKAEYPLPMFVNAALHRSSSIADALGKPRETATSQGRFGMGGPMDDLLDVWRAGGPAIDMLSPDAYGAKDFPAWCEKYSRAGNPLFIAETSGGAGGAPTRSTPSGTARRLVRLWRRVQSHAERSGQRTRQGLQGRFATHALDRPAAGQRHAGERALV